MADATLGPSSFIVMGFLHRHGALTSYDLKRWADASVGNFWAFPRSQLYAEPKRLVGLGLLSEHQEEGGRRRRTYELTDAGREALDEWLESPAGFPELRDLGLLKLYFLLDTPDDTELAQVHSLAAEQQALHEERLAMYHTIIEMDADVGPAALKVLSLGMLYEEANIEFWGTLTEERGDS